MSYGKHQTFFLRSNWIYKGIHAVINPDFQENIFVHSKKYYRVLGLGSSMLKSLRYWLEATCIVDFINGEHTLTNFGVFLMQHDIGANSNFSKLLIQYFLVSNFKVLKIVLEKGFNKIDFEALNQGDSGPNTAEFRVYDDKKNLVSASEWNLGTGFKATIILVKE